jgi:cell division septum initiation protein DivIVA
MSTLQSERNYVPDQLVDQLVKGYDALSTEIKLLDEQRRELENRLSWAKQQV